MHIADVRTSGWAPLQHHEPGLPLGLRKRAGAVRLHPREEETDDEPGKDTYGVVEGGLFWKTPPGGPRGEVHGWWMGGVGVVFVAGAAGPSDPKATRTRGLKASVCYPIAGKSSPDRRFMPMPFSLAPGPLAVQRDQARRGAQQAAAAGGGSPLGIFDLDKGGFKLDFGGGEDGGGSPLGIFDLRSGGFKLDISAADGSSSLGIFDIRKGGFKLEFGGAP